MQAKQQNANAQANRTSKDYTEFYEPEAVEYPPTDTSKEDEESDKKKFSPVPRDNRATQKKRQINQNQYLQKENQLTTMMINDAQVLSPNFAANIEAIAFNNNVNQPYSIMNQNPSKVPPGPSSSQANLNTSNNNTNNNNNSSRNKKPPSIHRSNSSSILQRSNQNAAASNETEEQPSQQQSIMPLQYQQQPQQGNPIKQQQNSNNSNNMMMGICNGNPLLQSISQANNNILVQNQQKLSQNRNLVNRAQIQSVGNENSSANTLLMNMMMQQQQQQQQSQFPQYHKKQQQLQYSSSENAEKLTQEYQNLYTALEEQKRRAQCLEESLRNETLNSEEQRTYIEILKAELERKMMDSGFMNFFKTANSAPNLSHIDIYLELQQIKGKLIEKDERLGRAELLIEETRHDNQRLQEKSSVILAQNASLSQANQDLEAETTSALQQVEHVQREAEELRAERDQLADFAKELEAEKARLEEQAESLSQQLNEVSEREQKSTLALNEQSEQRQRDVEELHSLRLLNEEVEKARRLLLKEKEQLTQENLNLTTQLQDFEQQLQQGQDRERDGEERLREAEQRYALLRDELEPLKGKFEETKENVLTLSNTLQETNAELEKVQARAENLEQAIQAKEETLQQREQRLRECQQLLREAQEQVRDLTLKTEEQLLKQERDRSTRTEEIKKLYEQVSVLRAENRDLREEKLNADAQRQAWQEDQNNCKEHIEKLKNAYIQGDGELREYKRVLAEKENELAKCHANAVKQQADIQFYEKQVMELRGIAQQQQQQSSLIMGKGQLQQQQQQYQGATNSSASSLQLQQQQSQFQQQQTSSSYAAKHEAKRAAMGEQVLRERGRDILGRLKKFFQVYNNRESQQQQQFQGFQQQLEEYEQQDYLNNNDCRGNGKLQFGLDINSNNDCIGSSVSGARDDLENVIAQINSQVNQLLQLYQQQEEKLTKLLRERDENKTKNALLQKEMDAIKKEHSDLLSKLERDFSSRDLQQNSANSPDELKIKDYLLRKCRQFIFEEEVLILFDELAAICKSLISLEKQRQSLGFQSDEISSTRSSLEARKHIEDISQEIAIVAARKKSVEAELQCLQDAAQNQFSNVKLLSKQNQKLKSELRAMNSEIEIQKLNSRRVFESSSGAYTSNLSKRPVKNEQLFQDEANEADGFLMINRNNNINNNGANCNYNSQKTDLILNNLEDKQNLFNFDPDFDLGDVARKKYFN